MFLCRPNYWQDNSYFYILWLHICFIIQSYCNKNVSTVLHIYCTIFLQYIHNLSFGTTMNSISIHTLALFIQKYYLLIYRQLAVFICTVPADILAVGAKRVKQWWLGLLSWIIHQCKIQGKKLQLRPVVQFASHLQLFWFLF